MAFSVEPVLMLHKKRADGRIPLAIRTTINRKTTYKSTGFKIMLQEWDSENKKVTKANASHQYINSSIKKYISDIERDLAMALSQGKPLSIDVVRPKQTYTGLLDYIEKKIPVVSVTKKGGTVKHYESKLRTLKEMIPHDIGINSITGAWLDQLKADLLNKPIGGNTVWNYFKFIRKFYLMAQREGLIQRNAIKDMEEFPKFVDPSKTYLVLAELDSLEDLLKTHALDTTFQIVLNYFLLECYSGIRNIDWPLFSIEKPVHENNLKLNATKNGEPVYINIDKSPRLKRTLERIAQLPPYDMSNQATNRILKSLAAMAKIKKDVSTHAGRHTFAVMSATLGLSLSTTAEILGITEKTCKVYYKVTREKVNKEFGVWSNI